MTMADFAGLADDFLRITTETVFCVATTVDPQGRPRECVLRECVVGKLTGGVWHSDQ